MKTYDLPKHFYWDHEGRMLPSGTVIKELANKMRVQLNKDEYDEMLSDAEHYMDTFWIDEDRHLRGLALSARATVRALKANPQ